MRKKNMLKSATALILAASLGVSGQPAAYAADGGPVKPQPEATQEQEPQTEVQDNAELLTEPELQTELEKEQTQPPEELESESGSDPGQKTEEETERQMEKQAEIQTEEQSQNETKEETKTFPLGSQAEAALKDGVLAIRGTGTVPKGDYGDDIQRVEELQVGEGITGLGESAFAGMVNLAKASLPGSLTEIGPLAFADCVSLREVSGAAQVSRIGERAFVNNVKVTFTEYPSRADLGEKAFWNAWKIKPEQLEGCNR